MDLNTIFSNVDLEDEVIEGCYNSKGSHLVFKLRKSRYDLKQTSQQWDFKFYSMITTYDFVENIVDQCIYLKVSQSKFIFLILYVDNILITYNY